MIKSIVAPTLYACLTIVGLDLHAQEPNFPPPSDSVRAEHFEKHVRPLLATHCYECHSQKADKLQAGLFVDSRQGLLDGGDSGPAIVPGKPGESLLIGAVRYEDFEMPPRGRLTDQEIKVLESWVADGAWWPKEDTLSPTRKAVVFDWQKRKAQHWAWKDLATAPLPTVIQQSWPGNEIDLFVLAELEAAGLKPAPRANREQLVRRVYFDLIGLPPTEEQVHEFLNDTSEDAYEQLVEQLLDSPHFGEKWARHWMDLVRYAETCGHEFDYPLAHAHQYRDYLVRAFNADVPYNQFVTEHLAGDLLKSPRKHPQDQFNESIIGTGFWFLGDALHAPTDVRRDEANRIDNQLDVFGKTFLGLTIACARCHDHKFDAIPTTDYYALAGYLQSSCRQDALLDPGQVIDSRQRQAGSLRKQRQKLLSQVLHNVQLDISTCLTALQSSDIKDASHPLYVWHQLSAATENFEEHRHRLLAQLEQELAKASASQQSMQRLADFRTNDYEDWFVTGHAFAKTKIGDWPLSQQQPLLRHAGQADSGLLGTKFEGVLRSPTFELNGSHIHYRINARKVQIRLVIDGYFMHQFAELLFADTFLKDVNTDGDFKWVTQHRDLYHYRGHRAHIEIIDNGDGDAVVESVYLSDSPAPPELPHELNLKMLRDDSITSLEQLKVAYIQCLQTAVHRCGSSDADKTDIDLANWLLSHELVGLNANLWADLQASIDQTINTVPAPIRAIALADGTGEDERVHIRGSHQNLGVSVPRRFLLALGGDERNDGNQQTNRLMGSGRRELAQRVVDSPLVPRVIVNRIWHHLLGRGIVATVDDFGVMGESPTHPELLDWLANHLIDNGWSLKATIRSIVSSNTYQLSTAAFRPDDEQTDPTNRLLHRAHLRRLPAEAIRDAMLVISGRFDPSLSGPSTPIYLTAQMTGRGRPETGPLDGAGRRSIYIKIQRNFLSPMMLAFDAPSPFSTMGRRGQSNVPAQSLILMNDPFVWQQAKRWSKQLIQRHANPQGRIEQAFLQAYAHPPNATQLKQIEDFVNRQALAREQDIDSVEVWTDVTHALWNAKEFIYLY